MKDAAMFAGICRTLKTTVAMPRLLTIGEPLHSRCNCGDLDECGRKVIEVNAPARR